MVHGWAAQSGGRLILDSQLGRGTTATILLPILEDRFQPLAAKGPHSRPVPHFPNQLSVLVVDDDTEVMRNTIAMLEDLGHRATGASSGRDALDLISSGDKFDIVITDQVMPNMSGSQLIEEIKRRGLELPTLLTTAYSDLPPGIAVGAPRLPKPFLQNQLAFALADAMRL